MVMIAEGLKTRFLPSILGEFVYREICRSLHFQTTKQSPADNLNETSNISVETFETC